MTTTEPSVTSTVPRPKLPTLDTATKKSLDAMIAELADGEKIWAGMDLTARIALLDATHASVAANAEAWVDAAIAAKSIDPDSEQVGEEWLTGPYGALTSIAMFHKTLTDIDAGRSPIAKRKLGSAPGGRVTVPVLPANAQDAMLFHGFSAEVWMKPGVSAEKARTDAGLGELHPTDTQGVGLVLGAGNITAIAPLDVLYELIAHNRVVILKLNPVMDRMLAPYTAAFAPLIERGLLRIVNGGGDIGGYLANHDGISHVHMTGSAATHDAIVWGPGAEGAKRKAAKTPLLTTPITSELGGVGPVIVLPGDWSAADLKYQAEHVVSQRLHNGGYNCIAGQVVVLSSDWPQKDAFLQQVRIAMAQAPSRVPWYPGSDGRVERAAEEYPIAERFGTRLLIDLPTDQDATDLMTTEYFSPVLGVIELEGTGQAFFDRAVDTANEDFVGTLGANIIGLPSTMKAMGAGFDATLARLRYGTIAINAWTGVGFLLPGAPWGAFPGHTLEDISSGIGVVHNGFLLDDTERVIVRGPFRPFPRSVVGGEFSLFPKPPWFVSARSAKATGKRLEKFAAKPSWLKMPGVFAAAFRA